MLYTPKELLIDSIGTLLDNCHTWIQRDRRVWQRLLLKLACESNKQSPLYKELSRVMQLVKEEGAFDMLIEEEII